MIRIWNNQKQPPELHRNPVWNEEASEQGFLSHEEMYALPFGAKVSIHPSGIYPYKERDCPLTGKVYFVESVKVQPASPEHGIVESRLISFQAWEFDTKPQFFSVCAFRLSKIDNFSLLTMEGSTHLKVHYVCMRLVEPVRIVGL